MIADSWQAYILHMRRIGDSSAQIAFFTMEQGFVRCMQKGARTLKKHSRSQPFTPMWLSVNRRGDACFVNRVEQMGKTLNYTGHNLFSALYINELLYYSLHPFDPYPELFAAYQTALAGLHTAQGRYEIEAVLRCFEYRLLAILGYEICLLEDAHATPLEPLQHYRYSAGNGFYPDSSGIQGSHILSFAHNRLDEPDVLRAAKTIMRLAIDQFLDGKPIKARELFVTQL